MDFIDNIELSPKAETEITRYRSSFGEAWTKRALRAAKAKAYIEQHLTAVDHARSGGNCYASGKITFTRKDGEAITDDDIKAILTIERGQENHVTKREERSVTIHWLCDSSG